MSAARKRGRVLVIPARRRTIAPRRSCVEPLEKRTLLASLTSALQPIVDSVSQELTINNVIPPSRSLWNSSGFLSSPSNAAPLTIAMDYLKSHAKDLGLSSTEIAASRVTNQYTDAQSGITHIYLQQEFNRLPVVNANLNVAVMGNGSILSVAGGYVPGLGAAISNVPARTAATATRVAAEQLTLAKPGSTVRLTASAPARTAARRTTIHAASLSLDPIPAQLVYVPTSDGKVQLAWDMVMRTPDGDHWYDVAVGDLAGKVVFANDWVDHATYNVLPVPTESPQDGPSFPNRQIVVNPEDPLASPFGWNDTNGVAGPENTTTQGNNVIAQEDVDQNNGGGFRPDGGPTLNFDFPFDATQEPIAYQSASIANLYYWTNILHDIHYHYGFTEAAGNFQQNNYGRGGQGLDRVTADAQDGGARDNANFATPPDGSFPRMQMYLWDGTSPMRDGSFDAQIMIHEYGHGVSNRLTGGPGNASALVAAQSAGMGEGWSDFWALMLTQKSTDTQAAAYPIGTYVMGQSPLSGQGIRRKPYSYDFAFDNITVDSFGQSGVSNTGYNRTIESHNTGEIWASTLWDLNWLLIDKHGFSSNVAAGYDPATGNDKGNQLCLRLIMDALKLQPANPSFKQARDAILQADLALTNGANQIEIWQAFARRGMGASFYDEASYVTSVIPAYDLPILDPYVQSTSPPTNLYTLNPVSSIDFNFSETMDRSSFSVADDVVDFTGPAYADLRSTISGFSWLQTTINQKVVDTLRINFTTTSHYGAYSLTLGPNILAFDDGHPMDQNLNRTPGEFPGDRFTASFNYVATLGPDGFGYHAAKYPFENIDLVPGAPGVSSLMDDGEDTYNTIDLGSNVVNFYGTNFTSVNQLFLTTNGYVSFFSGTSYFTNGAMVSNPPQKTIAPYWDDWETNIIAAGNPAGDADNDIILYKFEDTVGDSRPDRLIIEWNNVFHVTGQASGVTFQVILQLNTNSTPSRIIFNYPDLDTGSATTSFGASQTEGIKDAGTTFSSRLVISQDATSGWIGSGKAILIGMDVDAPYVVTENYEFATGPDVRIVFSEDVAVSLSIDDAILQNLTDSTTIPAASLQLNYDPTTRIAAISFPGFPGGVPPDGNYRLTFISSSITDAAGNIFDGDADGYISGNHSFDFFVLAGDANHDRNVDIKDLGVLGANWQSNGMTFAQGDFDYNGIVDAADLGILSHNWQKTLAAPTPTSPINLPSSPPPITRPPARKPARAIELLRSDS